MFWYEDTPIYIYGAGLKGKLIFELLKKMDCNVCGFLDRVPENICTDQTVCRPEQLSEEERGKSIVICSVANVFEHVKIASYLAKLGYLYLIYKEIFNCIDANHEIIDVIWNAIEDMEPLSIAEMKAFMIGREVSAFQSKEEKLHEIKITEKNGCVDMTMPVIFLYTFPKDLYILFHKRQDWLRIPYERNVYYYLYCADLFRMFENGAESDQEWENTIKIYKRYFSNADVYAEKDLDIKFRQHISQRYNIYKEMNKLFSTNRRFFDENPILVKWNADRNCLYVRDGNNRLGFLMAKGVHDVACRMTREDYDQWLEKQDIEKLALSEQDDKIQARIALQWMGKLDLLAGVNRALILSSNFFLTDSIFKMGVDVVTFDNIDSKGKIDLIWANLQFLSSQEKKEKIVSLFEENFLFFVAEGTRDEVQQFAGMMHGEVVNAVYGYWNHGKEIEIDLIRKGNRQ